jgi:hypothetical protein
VRGEGRVGTVGATTGPASTAVFADATKGGDALAAFSPNGIAVSATSNSLAGWFYGDVVVVGTLRVTGGLAVTGAKSAVVRCPDGRQRALYAIEAPESWFEDVGEAQLRRGGAEVRLAKDFAGVIQTARYQVFLTPTAMPADSSLHGAPRVGSPWRSSRAAPRMPDSDTASWHGDGT